MSFSAKISIIMLQIPEAVDLSEMNDHVLLKTNVAIKAGRKLTIRGGGSSVVPGQFQFEVQKGGFLHISDVTISGSLKTPAIRTAGFTELRDAVMQENGLDKIADGAAIYVMPGGRLNAISTRFLRNKASKQGGAIGCTGSELVLADTEISSNVATYEGGAIAALKGCSILFRGRTTINDNSAYSAGGAFLVVDSIITFEGSLQASGNRVPLDDRRCGGLQSSAKSQHGGMIPTLHKCAHACILCLSLQVDSLPFLMAGQ